MKTPLQLFREGMDTMRISKFLRIPEAEIERQIHVLRSAEKKDEAQRVYADLKLSRQEHEREYKRRYYVKKKNSRPGLVPYAGFEGKPEWDHA
jgi:hypothetical protein